MPDDSQIVQKPWGKEVWLELNSKYCYKCIHINSGHRTSLQYHKIKLETIYVAEGEAEVWLENDDGNIDKKIMKSGDWFTVIPLKKHRVVALSDVVLLEVSTPEVDDVVRVDDKYGRT